MANVIGELMKGKQGIVLGVANKRSIAWAIAQTLASQGARLAITYQSERVEKYVRELAQEVQDPLILRCDVTKEDEIKALMATVGSEFGSLDFVMHSVAYGDLDQPVLATSREAYLKALEISAYSLVAVAGQATKLMSQGGSIATMTYYGSEKVVPGYNIMGVAKATLEASVRYLAHDLGPRGVRVNAVSAGPLSTLAARSISGFTQMRSIAAERAPLRRPVEVSEVANTALFLLSDMASGITGEVVYVDCGYHIMGM